MAGFDECSFCEFKEFQGQKGRLLFNKLQDKSNNTWSIMCVT